MKKNIVHINLILTFILVCGSLTSQEIAKLSETVKFITDRDLYLTNEKIWFGGNVSSNDLPSKVLYIDLFDNNGQLLSRKKCEVINGIFSGNIKIPHYAETGYYLLRSYTHLQKNYQEWQLSKKAIRVVNPTTPLSFIETDNTEPIFKRDLANRLVFWIPEHLVNDSMRIKLLCRDSIIDAIHTLNESGLGLVKSINNWDGITGVLLCNTHDTLQFDINNRITKEPIVEMEETNGLISLKIDLQQEITAQSKIKITSLHDGTVVDLDGFITKGKIDITFRNSKNIRGICQLHIVSDDMIIDPLYLFINPVKYKLDRPQLKSKNKTTSTKIVTSSLNGTIYNPAEGNLPDYLISNPMLIGSFIDNYSVTKEIEEQLSILVSLKSDHIRDLVSSQKKPVIKYEAETLGPIIQGKVFDRGPISNEVFCSFVDHPQMFYTTISDSTTGGFSINPGNKLTSGDIYISTLGTNKDSIEVYSNYLNKAPTWEPVSFTSDSSLRSLLTKMYINSQYSDHFSNTEILDSTTQRCKLSIFAGNLNTYNMSDYIQMPTTKELFNEIIPFVRVRANNDGYEIVVLDEHTRVQYTNPLLIVDNIYYPNVDAIMNLQPSEIAKIEVIARKYYFGDVVFNGIIRVTSTSGILEDLIMPSNGVFFKYSSSDNFQQMKQRNPELSNTMQWEFTDSESYDSKNGIEGYNYRIIDLN